VTSTHAIYPTLEFDLAADEGPIEPLPPHFDVRGVLGQGGMGVVLEAHDRRLGRDVAIKVLTTGTSGRRRFVREARAAAVLRDPTIVTLYELATALGVGPVELVRED
jgi:serine/threonine protein kinase